MYLSPDEVEIIDAEVADSDRLRSRLQGVGSAAATTERARQTAAEASLADDRMGVHLHEAFDQTVGLIHQSTDLAASAPSDAKRAGFTAGSIVDMLLSPESIRNAIILGEVLRRPDDRW
jgi:hypothetical protein